MMPMMSMTVYVITQSGARKIPFGFTNLTEDEKKALEEAKAKAEELIDTIEEITSENVTPENKSNLENAKADIADLNWPVDSNSPATGDIWLWVALLFVSGAGILGITLYDSKRRAASRR